jgi:hypothetical protein
LRYFFVVIIIISATTNAFPIGFDSHTANRKAFFPVEKRLPFVSPRALLTHSWRDTIVACHISSGQLVGMPIRVYKTSSSNPCYPHHGGGFVVPSVHLHAKSLGLADGASIDVAVGGTYVVDRDVPSRRAECNRERVDPLEWVDEPDRGAVWPESQVRERDPLG